MTFTDDFICFLT